jgi:hypothetical protein
MTSLYLPSVWAGCLGCSPGRPPGMRFSASASNRSHGLPMPGAIARGTRLLPAKWCKTRVANAPS